MKGHESVGQYLIRDFQYEWSFASGKLSGSNLSIIRLKEMLKSDQNKQVLVPKNLKKTGKKPVKTGRSEKLDRTGPVTGRPAGPVPVYRSGSKSVV